MIAAAVLLVLAGVYLSQALGYDVGTLERPGPALFPMVIGVGLAAVSVGLGVEGARTPKEETFLWPYASGLIRLGVAIGVCALYIIVIPVLGQLISGVLLSAGLLWAMRLKRWWLLIILSVVFSVGVDLLFRGVLGVQLPAGLISF
jgi:hypothetical protein